MNPRDVIAQLRKAGWTEVRQTGGHRHFKHPERPGLVTVPMHSGDIDKAVLRSIERQSGISLRPKRS